MHDKIIPSIWNPFESGYKENPYQQLGILRRTNPVHKGINGRWLLLKYDDVKYFFTSPIFKTVKISQMMLEKNRFLRAGENINKLSEISAKWMLFFEPPQHTELRSMTARIWNQYDMTAVVEEIVADTVAKLEKKRAVDIISEFACYIPSQVVCRILGLPKQDYMKLRKWSYCFNSMLEPFSNLNDFKFYNEKAIEFFAYLDKIIESKKKKPDEAFISKFIEANEEIEKPLNQSEIISALAFLFFAGIETSINLFGESVLLLIRTPKQAKLLREDDSITSNGVEELLRYITPSQYTTRVAAEDVEIRGKKIKAGEYVMGATVSANREEGIFENSEELDLTRTKNPHLSFGFGLHYCLGARLARLETFHSLPALFRRFPNIELDPNQNYIWDKIIINRGLKSLPVILNA